MSYFKVFIYALLTAPLILFNVSHATVYTTGDLEYDTDDKIIKNTETGLTYLGWDVLAGLNYAETLHEINNNVLYGDYHIADKEEAKTFFEAAISNWQGGLFSWGTDMEGVMDYYKFAEGAFGNSLVPGWAVAMFVYDNGLYGDMQFQDGFDYGHWFNTADPGGLISNAGFLLVANTVSAVPVPAAIWLFGTALIGFVGISRRRKLA